MLSSSARLVSGAQPVLALYGCPVCSQMLVEAPLLALTEDVFQGVSTPIRLNRTVSVVGSPALPEPPLILLFAYQKVSPQCAFSALLTQPRDMD